jgi:simple sugar transport system ATP-binding protein
VGSIQYIHRQVVAKRDDGVGVLLNSSELDEVLALADRIAVIYRARIVGVIGREEANRERIGLLMAGAVDRAAEMEAPAGEEEVTVT